jgi:hypothetical protein
MGTLPTRDVLMYKFWLIASSQRFFSQKFSHERVHIFIYFPILKFELRVYTLSYSTTPFFVKVFSEIVSQTICLGWL